MVFKYDVYREYTNASEHYTGSIYGVLYIVVPKHTYTLSVVLLWICCLLADIHIYK